MQTLSYSISSPTFKDGKANLPFSLVDSSNEPTYGLLGKELSMFSEAGFDMQKIHLKVRPFSFPLCEIRSSSFEGRPKLTKTPSLSLIA